MRNLFVCVGCSLSGLLLRLTTSFNGPTAASMYGPPKASGKMLRSYLFFWSVSALPRNFGCFESGNFQVSKAIVTRGHRQSNLSSEEKCRKSHQSRHPGKDYLHRENSALLQGKTYSDKIVLFRSLQARRRRPYSLSKKGDLHIGFALTRKDSASRRDPVVPPHGCEDSLYIPACLEPELAGAQRNLN